MSDISTPDAPHEGENPAGFRRLSVADAGAETPGGFPFTIAAPSFVLPAGAAENARFLADFFPEISLLFFETDACLGYTGRDLPADLARLPVSWHVHLPLDLPWQDGLDVGWRAIEGLVGKAAFLSPRRYVLHPPASPAFLVPLAQRFRDAGVDPSRVLLENVEETDLCAFWPEARDSGFGACLDLGHVLAYGQDAVLDLPGLWEETDMLHVNAPGEGGRHESLSRLDERGRELLRFALERFTGDTVTLEIFNERGLFESLELLGKWMALWKNRP